MSGCHGDPTVSVVIPAFNAAKTIGATVESALRQSDVELDVLVVNDGSTDATEQVVAGIEDPRVRLVSQANRGLPAARNTGIASTRGRYVAFLDSDDLLLPDFLECGLRVLRERANPGFAYTDAYVFDEASGRLRETSAMARFNPPVPPPRDTESFLSALMRSNFVYVSTIAPREVLEKVGGFNESLTSCEDYDLWLRILLDGYEAAWFPGRHAIYRLHRGQMTRNATRMARNLAAVYDELPLDAMPSDHHRALLLRRRRQAHFSWKFLSPIRRALPAAVLLSAGRKRNRWYDTVPSDVAEAFASLR